MLLERGDALDIGEKLERLLRDEALRRRSAPAAGGSPRSDSPGPRAPSGYGSSTRGPAAPGGPPAPRDLEETVERYGAVPRSRPAAVGYATVRDYCDSADHLPALASVNGDLKDVQRPWTLKAILGRVPSGGRLLEIGAGDPHVADMLARIGYDVTLIDPYDGRDRARALPRPDRDLPAPHRHPRSLPGAGETTRRVRLHLLDLSARASAAAAIPALWDGIRRRTSPPPSRSTRSITSTRAPVTTTTSRVWG